MKNFKVLLVALLISGFAFAAAPGLVNSKYGFVNMNDVFESYYKTYNAKIMFEQKKHEIDDRLSVLKNGVEEMFRELQNLAQDAQNELLDEKVRQDAIAKIRVREEIFAQKREEYAQTREKSIQELRNIQAETEQALVKELLQIVKKYATNKGYTHVIDVSGNSMNGLPVFILYPEQEDITKSVIPETNKGHEKELQEAKAKFEAMTAPAK